MEAYCVKCKTKREIVNPQTNTTATGRSMTRGTCKVCGGGLSRWGKPS